MAKVIDSLLVGFGIDVDKASFSSASAGLDDIKSSAMNLAGVVAGGIGIKDLTLDFAAATDELGKFSNYMGLAPGKVQAFERAIRHAGGSADEARSMIKNASDMLDRFRVAGELTGAERLGINPEFLRDAKDAEDVLRGIAEQLEKMSLGQARAVGESLGFGQAGVEFLRNGGAGIDQAMRDSQRLGQITSEMTVNAANFNDALQDLSDATGHLKGLVSNDLIQPLTEMSRRLTGFITENPEEAESLVTDYVYRNRAIAEGLFSPFGSTISGFAGDVSAGMANLYKGLGLSALHFLAPDYAESIGYNTSGLGAMTDRYKKSLLGVGSGSSSANLGGGVTQNINMNVEVNDVSMVQALIHRLDQKAAQARDSNRAFIESQNK